MSNSNTPKSPKITTGGIVHFARMLDKARLHLAGRLPADYTANLGDAQPGTFDDCTLKFLGVKYADVLARLREGFDDGALLEWCFANGRGRPDAREIAVWNAYMAKMGWRDETSAFVAELKAAAGWQNRDDIQTFFDIIEADEGRM
ncbi:MAG: DUF5069 domain-containing protein [Puniceicoccales bacterium]|jgi:gluconokinase|nr:DUF5069 domain-containing protein [Puniceicoccales bacterium]